METWIVTGGAGFIGSNFVHRALARGDRRIVVLDKLTYAGHRESLAGAEGNPRFRFVAGDIADRALVRTLFAAERPAAVVNFAAESHVDRSIEAPGTFVETNVVGVFELLEAARGHLAGLPDGERERFRFLHVSTDEVYGSLGAEGLFREDTPYDPRSPYSASKAASDHFVRAWHETYGDEVPGRVGDRKAAYLASAAGRSHVLEVVRSKLRAGGRSDAVIDALGPAPAFGRVRWQELTDLLERAGNSARSLEMLKAPTFRALHTDKRLQDIPDGLREKTSRARADTWSAKDGTHAAKVSRAGKRLTLTFDDRVAPKFGDFVRDRLQALYDEFKAGDPSA